MTAVEVDGPSHYLKGRGTRPSQNGSTAFKSRILRQLGWTVLNIPYFEWGTLVDATTKDAYLRSKFESKLSSS
eukprot:CAMPEP_0197286678 /NCGR_PEP_ID=MMETSP0890-20130614/2252_1 /TAXON_ID=44058 ORGANISM="Aureoumbra lagunensis, Strain CCMP1510" /NCGR_SAMPLE_ID=MMETSP0890 /ASSEMBLY_ACC=CAM_ASM_000533 /LENGTH=72 /DNA_ID=CAMNT_0042755277 /DNA_START=33 /DNA_END=251 /DNA_ORIENTATION=+